MCPKPKALLKHDEISLRYREDVWPVLNAQAQSILRCAALQALSRLRRFAGVTPDPALLPTKANADALANEAFTSIYGSQRPWDPSRRELFLHVRLCVNSIIWNRIVRRESATHSFPGDDAMEQLADRLSFEAARAQEDEGPLGRRARKVRKLNAEVAELIAETLPHDRALASQVLHRLAEGQGQNLLKLAQSLGVTSPAIQRELAYLAQHVSSSNPEFLRRLQEMLSGPAKRRKKKVPGTSGALPMDLATPEEEA